MSDRRMALVPEDRSQRSRAAAALLVGLPEAAHARVVAGFVAARGEIDPAPVLEDFRRRGGEVVLPRVSDGSPRLRFHAATAADLRPGAYGMLEPDPACREVPVEAIDLFVVPGLAFDGAGRRLGYGGGYYDELSAHVRGAKAVLIGFAYDFQIVARCPAGEGDRPVACVVTDDRVLRPAAGNAS